MVTLKFFLVLGCACAFGVAHTDAAVPSSAEARPVTSSNWKGYTKQSFTLDGRAAFVVEPKIAAPGNPWVWRTSFPDYHTEVDVELLRNGAHVGFVSCVDMLGNDAALDVMDQFYDQVRRQWGLSLRPALEAVSRGGLHAYRYAARHPERIACIYADSPVMDLKSWPRKWPAAQPQWQRVQELYGFADEAAVMAFKGNPLDLLAVIAKAKIPLRHVICLNDEVVPPEENTLEAKRRLAALGSIMELVVVKEGTAATNGHHFTLPEVPESVGFILRHASVQPEAKS